MKTIHEEMKERADLAFAYAEDGALGKAGEIFAVIAHIYQERAREVHELREGMEAQGEGGEE